MQMKRYRGATMREALALARCELGPSALVLSTRSVAAPGPRGWLGRRLVELTAAVDRPEPDVSDDRPARPLFRQHWATLAEPEQVSHTESLFARLRATGLDPAIVVEVVDSLPPRVQRDVPLSTLRHVLAERFEALSAGREGGAPVEVFVGPPGSGKTTTIAKIAAQERARRGRRHTLVAADGFRVGAVDQLRLYADIIGCPLRVVRTPDDLDALLDDPRGSLLVDTAGRSPRDPEARALFEQLAGRPGVRTQLVMPAASAPREAERILDGYQVTAPARVVLSKVDEADSIAPLMGLLRERKLRVSFLGTGQRVPEDLERATPEALATRALGDARPLAGGRA